VNNEASGLGPGLAKLPPCSAGAACSPRHGTAGYSANCWRYAAYDNAASELDAVTNTGQRERPWPLLPGWGGEAGPGWRGSTDFVAVRGWARPTDKRSMAAARCTRRGSWPIARRNVRPYPPLPAPSGRTPATFADRLAALEAELGHSSEARESCSTLSTGEGSRNLGALPILEAIGRVLEPAGI